MDSNSLDVWGVLEIMGHVRLAGRITEQAIGGAGMIRIDVPETDRAKSFTRFFGASSIYSITPTSEEVARGIAETLRAEPIRIYELPSALQKMLPVPDRDDDDDLGSGW